MKRSSVFPLFLLMVSALWAGEKPFKVIQVSPIGLPVRSAVIAPRWSPDGKQFAFSAPGYKGLWIASPDGGMVKQVSDKPASGYGFFWSPGSDRLSYTVARFTGLRRENAVTVYTLKNNKHQQLTSFATRMPLAPQWVNNSEIRIGEKKEQRASVSAKAPASPQRSLVYVRNQKIYLERPQSLKTLIPFPGKDYLNVHLSPDGRKIVFEVMGGNLFIINTDGSARVDLGRGYRPAWSPDSHFVVFMRTSDDGHIYTASDLWVASFDGEIVQQLTNTTDHLEMDPDWSPDGRKILYDDLSDGRIYQLTIEKR